MIVYQTIWELPTPVLNSLNEEDATKWMTAYNQCDPKSKDEITEAKKKAWRSVENAPSSFSFRIIASTDTVDKAREVIDLESIKKHMDSFIDYGGNIQNDHHNYTVGTIWDWAPCKVKDDRGREVDGILTYGNLYGGDFVYDKIRQSFIKGMNSLSVAGEALPGRYQCDEKGCYTRRKVQQLMEISLCVDPMNKYCTLVDYNKDASIAKSDSAMSLKVKEYTIHKDQSACPITSLKKSLRSIGYQDVHAKEDGVHIPMSREEFEQTLPIMKRNGLVARYFKGEAIIHRRDDILERAFKRSIASGFCTPDGALSATIPQHVFSEYLEYGIIGKDALGGYGFVKANPTTLYVMVGYPGSGKSTYAQQLAQKVGADIVSTDAIRKELYGDESIQGQWPEIEERLHQRMGDTLKGGRSVIMDATNLSPRNREFIKRYNQDYPVIAHVMDTTLDQSIENNKKRAMDGGREVDMDYYEKLRTNPWNKPPELSEGFTDIVHVPWAPSP